MTKFGFFAGTIFLTVLSCPSVHALPLQTFVSTSGSDANNCGLATPCRFFSGAIPKTAAGGVIVALESGPYGAANVDKALTLMAAPGVHAAMGTAVIGDVVSINAGASDVVVLRNLYVSRLGSSGNGIQVNSVGTLHIEGCTITRFTGGSSFGINIAAGSPQVFINDTFIRDNGAGIFARGAMAIDHCRIENNNSTGFGYGVGVSSGAKVSIRDSIVSGHSLGLSLQFSSGAELDVDNCLVFNNAAAGISIDSVSSAGTVRVSNSTVFNNGIGFKNSIGVFQSRGNNTVRGNGNNTQGTITLISGT